MVTHDVFWPTIAQTVGTGILVVATTALVVATFALVNATKILAKVGEDTWKSQVVPAIWTIVKCGSLSDSGEAIFSVRNGSAIDVKNVCINIFLCAYEPVQAGQPLLKRSKKEIYQTFALGNLSRGCHQISYMPEVGKILV